MTNTAQMYTQATQALHLMLNNQPNQEQNQSTTLSQNQQPVSTANLAGQMAGSERSKIWFGLLEWIESAKNPTDQQKLRRHVPCSVSSTLKDGEPELKADSWPQKLILQLMPKQLISSIGGMYLRNCKSVLFHPQNSETLESLTRVMSTGFVGCVHFASLSSPSTCDIKVLILMYTAEKRAYLGFIPNDQAAFVDRLRRVIQQCKSSQQLFRQGQIHTLSVLSDIAPPSEIPPQNAVQKRKCHGEKSTQLSKKRKYRTDTLSNRFVQRKNFKNRQEEEINNTKLEVLSIEKKIKQKQLAVVEQQLEQEKNLHQLNLQNRLEEIEFEKKLREIKLKNMYSGAPCATVQGVSRTPTAH